MAEDVERRRGRDEQPGRRREREADRARTPQRNGSEPAQQRQLGVELQARVTRETGLPRGRENPATEQLRNRDEPALERASRSGERSTTVVGRHRQAERNQHARSAAQVDDRVGNLDGRLTLLQQRAGTSAPDQDRLREQTRDQLQEKVEAARRRTADRRDGRPGRDGRQRGRDSRGPSRDNRGPNRTRDERERGTSSRGRERTRS